MHILEFLASVGSALPPEVAIPYVQAQVAEIHRQYMQQGFDPASIPNDGIEFERWVADNLLKYGWDAAPTKASGDQGVDVIAKKQGLRVGIQCKLYSSPVGNASVQEVAAGKSFHGLDRVAVMSTAGYTESAKQLAAANGVYLLTEHDIPFFDKVFFG